MLEVDGHEFDRGDGRWKLVEMRAFHGLRRRMVDLEDANAASSRMRHARPSNPAPRMTSCLVPRATASQTASVDDLGAHRHQVRRRAREREPDARAFGADLRLDACESARPLSLRNTRAVGSWKSRTCVAPASARARMYATIVAVLLARRSPAITEILSLALRELAPCASSHFDGMGKVCTA